MFFDNYNFGSDTRNGREPSIVYARELVNIANPKFVTEMYEFLTNKNDQQLNVEDLRL